MATKNEVRILERVFDYNGTRLTDPGSHLTVDEVKDFFAGAGYSELLGAAVKGPKIEGDKEIYTFEVKIATKG